MRRTTSFLMLVFLLLSGCNGTQAGQTITPTAGETSTPTAVPPATLAPTSIPLTPNTSDVIIDGPWSSLPEGSDAGLTWDPELKAITLQTDPTNVAFVTQPDPDRDAFTNSIYSLGTFKGRLYLGYGDLYNNQGPVDIVSYDPTSGALFREMEDIPEEELGNWHNGESGRFYLAGLDSREPWAFGNFYVTDGFGWQKIRTIYRGLHVSDVVEYQGRLYAVYSSDNQTLVDYPFILVSSNWGLTWQYERLEQSTVQSTTTVKLATVHEATGDKLYASAFVRKPDGNTEYRYYRSDGQSWSRMTFNTPEGKYDLRDMLAFQDKLLVEFNGQNAQTGKWEFRTYTYDGQTQTEIPYLQGQLLRFSQAVEQDGWLYALIQPANSGASAPYTLIRTQNLQDWEELGDIPLQEGVTPYALAFSHDRLYIGVQNTWRQIEGNPPKTTLVMTSTSPLANATLTWDADVPSGTSLSFQIQAGKDYNEFSNAPFLGPDGTPDSTYTTPGQALPAQQEGATMFWVSMSKSPNKSGAMPFVRTVTLESTNGSTTFAVDIGSGLYTAANTTSSAQFTSTIFELEAPLANGGLFFDARTPADTGVTFQIRSGDTRDELEAASFVGPDGSGESAYTVNGMPLWEGHNGHQFIQYQATLSSDNPAFAPFLRQVALVTRGGILDHFEVGFSSGEPWVAGAQYSIQVSARSADNQVVPLSGELPLMVKIQGDQASSLLSQKGALFTNGEASVDVSLFKALPSQICVEIAGVSSCSRKAEVRSGPMAWLNVEAPDLPGSGTTISPHTDVEKFFKIVITAFDRYHNLVKDYTGSVHCEVWKGIAINPLIIPSYTFTAVDAGSHRFISAVSFSTPGEYSLVCLDDASPQLGGALAITAGEFDQAIFP